MCQKVFSRRSGQGDGLAKGPQVLSSVAVPEVSGSGLQLLEGILQVGHLWPGNPVFRLP